MDRKYTKTIIEIIELIKSKRLSNTSLPLIKTAIDEKKENINILIEISIQSAQIKNFEEAIFILNELSNLIKTDIRIYYNLGITYSMNSKHQQALEAYENALKINPKDVMTLINKGCTLNDMANYELALKTLKNATHIDQNFPEAWSNMGIALNNLGHHKDSIKAYEKAINLNKNYYEAWSNKSVPLNQLRLFNEALQACERAINLQPKYAEGWSNKGNTLHELKRYEEALIHYERALLLKKNIDWLLGNYLFLKAQIADWLNFEDWINELKNGIEKKEKVTTPFAALALIDDEKLHYRAAQIFSQQKIPKNSLLGKLNKVGTKRKIKLAYFSGDFREHAVSYLTAELFENHDREKFEIIGFAWEINLNDKMTQRIRVAFDHFIDVSEKSELQIAKLARDLDIDIAVDLMGYTQNSKTSIFSYRVAPIQCSYIGYLGSMGSDYYDYIIGDKTVIPRENRQYFSEKIVYLEHFQSNDSRRQVSTKTNNLENFRISKDVFVFCCFNNSYKIQPKIFHIWMEILGSVEKSVLWLIEGNKAFKKNLLMEAEKAGIDQSKVLFFPISNRQEYLERYQAVDLFLDTLPYNAGTTASDALWSGVPIITRLGNSYTGRMAASLLKTFDLQELIVNSNDQYRNVAIELANQPEKLYKLKSKIKNLHQNSRLFNNKLFCENLDSAYLKMYEMYQLGIQFEDIEVVSSNE